MPAWSSSVDRQGHAANPDVACGPNASSCRDASGRGRKAAMRECPPSIVVVVSLQSTGRPNCANDNLSDRKSINTFPKPDTPVPGSTPGPRALLQAAQKCPLHSVKAWRAPPDELLDARARGP